MEEKGRLRVVKWWENEGKRIVRTSKKRQQSNITERQTIYSRIALIKKKWFADDLEKALELSKKKGKVGSSALCQRGIIQRKVIIDFTRFFQFFSH